MKWTASDHSDKPISRLLWIPICMILFALIGQISAFSETQKVKNGLLENGAAHRAFSMNTHVCARLFSPTNMLESNRYSRTQITIGL